MNVKKILLPIFLLAIALYGKAQTIPNKGFEDWTFYKGSGYEVPARWVTNDILTARFNHKYKGTSTSKSSEAHSGNYAVKMQVVNDHGETVNGCIYSTGSVDSLVYFYAGKSSTGFKCSAQPTALAGYYKFTSVLGDSAIFGVTLTKWNKEKKQRDTCVNTIFIVGHTSPQYIPFVIPLTYHVTNEMPDTALIVIGIQAGQGKTAHLGTTLFVDDIGFSGKMPVKKQ